MAAIDAHVGDYASRGIVHPVRGRPQSIVTRSVALKIFSAASQRRGETNARLLLNGSRNRFGDTPARQPTSRC